MRIEIELPNGEKAICKISRNQFWKLEIFSTKGCYAQIGDDMYLDDELGFTESIHIMVKNNGSR